MAWRALAGASPCCSIAKPQARQPTASVKLPTRALPAYAAAGALPGRYVMTAHGTADVAADTTTIHPSARIVAEVGI